MVGALAHTPERAAMGETGPETAGEVNTTELGPYLVGVRGLNVSVLGRLDVEDELGAGLGDLSAPGTDGLRVVGAVGTGVGSGGGGHLPQTLAGEESLDADDPLGVSCCCNIDISCYG